ncbi:uncharacterized protein LOC107043191 [Diachasma alloeum]|uniref:uncharacterized protein LOC107043191 n=1 Tax=Diachasma alloeum TaxID=454923 RepID=UPI000738447D|nr:uncharacterized protein LOC107043191 [Diachasma alloeum]
MAARVLAATLMTVGITLEEVHLSSETLHRNRQKQREVLDHKIEDNFKNRLSHILTVHWDGKQLSAPENKFEKVDRLPVLVSGYGWNQLLGVPRLERGTGELQAKAVHHCLKEWDVVDNVCAMVFDITASNTGSVNGACILLEELLERDLLYLACRHHVYELVLKTAFESSMGGTSGPDVLTFKRFQVYWGKIRKGEFSPEVNDIAVKEALHDNMADDLAFAEEQLEKKNIRSDYREFLDRNFPGWKFDERESFPSAWADSSC